MEKEEVIQELKRIREKDPSFEEGRILSSVSSKPLGVCEKAFELFMDVNALDTQIFKQIPQMEDESIAWLSSLFGKKDADGYITTGGTEANIYALWIAKKRYPNRNRLLAPESAHYSIEKAADLMDLKLDYGPLNTGYTLDLNWLRRNLDQDVLAVIGTCGTSALGAVDPIDELNSLCKDVFLHVDAAFGGFVLPFLDKRIGFSFENVDSITVDPHKMGLTPIPCGCVLFRSTRYMRELRIDPSYIDVRKPTLLGSRSGASIASIWAAINHLGYEGYSNIVKGCMHNTYLFKKLISEIEGASLLLEPELNFTALKCENPRRVHEALTRKGWHVLLDEDTLSMRIVMMPHVTEDIIHEFVKDLREILEDDS